MGYGGFCPQGAVLRRRVGWFLAALMAGLVLPHCSFDYGADQSDNENQPDIVMRDVEYVRVRGGDPQVRFQAELAERYESRQIMELRQFKFEQFDHRSMEVNAMGQAGRASVELDSGNIFLDGDVLIAVDSEDITIETASLHWQDKERHLSGTDGAPVEIARSSGTTFIGRGFSADIRARTWAFDDGAEGVYIHKDDDDEGLAESEGAPRGREPAP